MGCAQRRRTTETLNCWAGGTSAIMEGAHCTSHTSKRTPPQDNGLPERKKKITGGFSRKKILSRSASMIVCWGGCRVNPCLFSRHRQRGVLLSGFAVLCVANISARSNCATSSEHPIICIMGSLGGPPWGKELRAPLALALVVLAVAAWKVRHPPSLLPNTGALSFIVPVVSYPCLFFGSAGPVA